MQNCDWMGYEWVYIYIYCVCKCIYIIMCVWYTYIYIYTVPHSYYINTPQKLWLSRGWKNHFLSDQRMGCSRLGTPIKPWSKISNNSLRELFDGKTCKNHAVGLRLSHQFWDNGAAIYFMGWWRWAGSLPANDVRRPHPRCAPCLW